MTSGKCRPFCLGLNVLIKTVGSGNDLALNRQQAITWTVFDNFLLCHIVSIKCIKSIFDNTKSKLLVDPYVSK